MENDEKNVYEKGWIPHTTLPEGVYVPLKWEVYETYLLDGEEKEELIETIYKEPGNNHSIVDLRKIVREPDGTVSLSNYHAMHLSGLKVPVSRSELDEFEKKNGPNPHHRRCLLQRDVFCAANEIKSDTLISAELLEKTTCPDCLRAAALNLLNADRLPRLVPK